MLGLWHVACLIEIIRCDICFYMICKSYFITVCGWPRLTHDISLIFMCVNCYCPTLNNHDIIATLWHCIISPETCFVSLTSLVFIQYLPHTYLHKQLKCNRIYLYINVWTNLKIYLVCFHILKLVETTSAQ